jgi:hypothetical protein
MRTSLFVLMRCVITLALILSFLSFSTEAIAYHAWVNAKNVYLGGAGSTTLRDVTDDAPNKIFDDMMWWGPDPKIYSGYANLINLKTGLMAYANEGQSHTYSYAKFEDIYTFTNQLDPTATGAVPGLQIQIDYNGTIITGGEFGVQVFKGPTHSLISGYTISGLGVYTGTWVIDLSANYNEPETLFFEFEAHVGGFGTVDFHDTADISFISTDSNVNLDVTSEGRFGIVPVPTTMLLLGSGLLGLAGFRKRFKKS